VGALGIERMYERDDVIGDDRGGIRGDSPRLVARAAAPQVGRDDPKALREAGDLLSPGARRLGKAVKQEDERALSFHHAVKTDAVDVHVPLHPGMLACPMPESARSCLATSPSASGSSRAGSPWSSG